MTVLVQSACPGGLHCTGLTHWVPCSRCLWKDLVDQHVVALDVVTEVLMLPEPPGVVAAFCILFFTVVIYVRLDFSIAKDPAAEAR